MTINETTPAIPDGYRMDAEGRLVPVASIKPEHLIEDELVRDIADEARGLNDTMAGLRAKWASEVDSFLALIAAEYGAKRGGKKGNLTLTSFDGQKRVQIAVSETLVFGPELQVAKELIDECLTAWSDGTKPELQAIVTDAFKVNKEGKVDRNRILALRRIPSEDPRWQRAMEAIGDSIRVSHSKTYVRIYERGGRDGAFVQIPLDLARV